MRAEGKKERKRESIVNSGDRDAGEEEGRSIGVKVKIRDKSS